MFDALIPLPSGTTYNAYLVEGEEKTALIDTVNPGFEEELVAKISQITDLGNLDYVVMNHAEPDHAAAIKHIMQISKNVTLVTTEKGARMAQVYYNVPEDRINTVKDGDTVELGGKTLKFIEAPWLHWPETMFTYLVENKILFSCDFLATHTALGLYDEDVEDMISLAKRYFGEIMMPFRSMGRKALEKIENLEIEMIAPSHGPIYKNPVRILKAYRRWTAGETEEKAIIVYVSMWGSTEAMVKVMVETLMSEGVEVSLHNLQTADVGEIAREPIPGQSFLAHQQCWVVCIPLQYMQRIYSALRPPLKYAAILSSYGWSGGAIKQALEILGPTKIGLVGSLEINGPPADYYQQIAEIGKQLSSKIKEDREG